MRLSHMFDVKNSTCLCYFCILVTRQFYQLQPKVWKHIPKQWKHPQWNTRVTQESSQSQGHSGVFSRANRKNEGSSKGTWGCTQKNVGRQACCHETKTKTGGRGNLCFMKQKQNIRQTENCQTVKHSEASVGAIIWQSFHFEVNRVRPKGLCDVWRKMSIPWCTTLFTSTSLTEELM